MRYFTRSLWDALQDPDTGGTAARQWDENIALYRRQLATIGDRIPQAAMTFFADADVHDGELQSFRVQQRNGGERYPVVVELRVAEGTGQRVWHVKYAVVRRVVLDYPTEEPLFHEQGEGLGDWGYHELTDAGDGFLRHEVLFASGSVLVVEFQKVIAEASEDGGGAA